MAIKANLQNSGTIFAIRSAQGVVARTSLRKTASGPVYRQFSQDMTVDGVALRNEVLSLSFMAYTIQHFIESGLKGAFTMIVPDSVAIRTYEARGVLNKGGDAQAVITKLTKDFMDDDYKGAIADLAEQLTALHQDPAIDMNVIKASNLTGWAVSDSQVDLVPGMILKFQDGSAENGAITLENNRISGEFELKVRQVINPETGEAKDHFYVDRAGNSVALRNARTLWNKAGELLPQEVALEDMDEEALLACAGDSEF